MKVDSFLVKAIKRKQYCENVCEYCGIVEDWEGDLDVPLGKHIIKYPICTQDEERDMEGFCPLRDDPSEENLDVEEE